ncbi:hypothetical protein ACSFBX_17730 [Variovorax sp. RB2P76]|jgi:hypothetical protein|uniref:hypothetical protein n=1 Tax=Variovorax sp. RB2P76 TaxID=3443736 RepID=UPI003F454FBC
MTVLRPMEYHKRWMALHDAPRCTGVSNPEGKTMNRSTWHNATITLKLPCDTAPDEAIVAMRAAGIPVDELGFAEAGFLHMRTTQDYRSHVFRWFANEDAGMRANGPTR